MLVQMSVMDKQHATVPGSSPAGDFRRMASYSVSLLFSIKKWSSIQAKFHK